MADDVFPVDATPEQVASAILGTTPEGSGEAPAPESSPSLEERAARAEAELSGAPEEKPEEVVSETPAAPETPAPASELKKLIDTKYGGDEGKFVSGLHEQWKSTARLAQELEELKKTLAPRDPAAPPEEEHPDLQWISGQIGALDTERVKNDADMKALVTHGQTLQAEIYQLQGELRRADELEKQAIEAKIERAEAKLDRLASKYDSLEDRNRRIDVEKRDFDRQKAYAERAQQVARAEQKQRELEFAAARDRELKEFEDSVEGLFQEYQVESQSDKDYIREIIRAQAVYQIRSLPEGSRLDLAAFVKAQGALHAQRLNFAKRTDFSNKTKEKLQTLARPPIAAAPSPAPPKPQTPPATQAPQPPSNKPWSAEFAKMRAAKILG